MKLNLVKVLFNFRVTQQQQVWVLCWLTSLSIGIRVSISKYNAGSGLSALSENVGSHSFLHRLGVNGLYQTLFMVVVCLWGAPQVTCLLFFLHPDSLPSLWWCVLLHRILCPTMFLFSEREYCYAAQAGLGLATVFPLLTSALGLQMCSTTPGSRYCFDWSWFRVSFRFCVGSR